MTDSELVEALFRRMAQGSLEGRYVLPVIEEMLGAGGAASSSDLLAVLEGRKGSAAEALAGHIKTQRRTEAFHAHQAKRSGAPLSPRAQELLKGLPLDAPIGWETSSRRLENVKAALSLSGDRAFLASRRAAAPRTASIIEKKYRELLPSVQRMAPSVWSEILAREKGRTFSGIGMEMARRRDEGRQALEAFLAGRGVLPANVEDEAALAFLDESFKKAATRGEKEKVLDAVCCWPTSRAASLIRTFGKEPWARERAALILVLRFGGANIPDWPSWNAWLLKQEMEDQTADQGLGDLSERRAPELLCLWLDRQDTPSALKDAVSKEAEKNRPTVDAGDFAERWATSLLPSEIEGLGEMAPSAPTAPLQLGASPSESLPETPAPPAPTISQTGSVPTPPKQSIPIPPPPVRRVAPKPQEPAPAAQMGAVDQGPSLWGDHLLPFFSENWPMVTGILMVIAGSSLLAYYTWDKNWLLRYTLMPTILGAFTAAIARLGRWLEARENRFQGMAHLLRGAAVGLLPVNFMTVTLLARDSHVPAPAIAVGVASLAYLVFSGIALRAWCGAVHPALGGLLGGALLLVNALTLVEPASRMSAPGASPNGAVEAGFYAAFLLLVVVVRRFAGKVLTRALAEDEKVPWFFGVSLVGTFVEVFLWVHGSLGAPPKAATYAPIVAGAGGLILYVESRALALRESPEAYRAESFLGFAFLLLGAFMGMSDPYVRPVTLVLAGGLWLTQTMARREPLHHWIGLTILTLGGVSVGLLDAFPGPWLPALGIALALGLGGLGALVRGGSPELAKASGQMQGTVLALSTVVAGLVQWHYGSPPLWTAGFLGVNAVLLLWRGLQDENLTDVHTGMGVLALGLPYLGCVDMEGRTLAGNTMAFGLGVLSWGWLTACKVSGSDTLRGARSTVLWLFGILAATAVGVRVVLEQGRPADALLSQFGMDYGGPVLMGAALVAAAYLSRSLVPSALAVVMLAVLLPSLKMEVHRRFPWVSWGSGLASSLWAVILTWTAFPLRGAAFLKDLDAGDSFYGKTPFPFRRKDHTLFTWPILAAAIFLAFKVDTLNVMRGFLGDGVRLKTAAALLTTGAAWTFLAVYLRERAKAVLFTHFGWMSAAAGIGFGYWRLSPAPVWHEPVVLAGVLFQVLYLLYRVSRAPWVRGLLAEPMRQVLMAGGVLFSILAAADLARGAAPTALWALLSFTALQLVWHGLSEKKALFGVLLFFEALITLSAWAAPGAGDLWERLSVAQSLTPALLFFLGVGALHLILEPAPAVEEFGRPILEPFLALAGCGTLLLGVGGLVDGVMAGNFSPMQQGLLMGALLLFGRAQASGPFVLVGLLTGYLLAQSGELAAASGMQGRLDLLFSPWRFGALSLALAVLGSIGRRVSASWPRSASGPFAQVFFRAPASPFVWGAALCAGFAAPMLHLADPALRADEIQLLAPYLGAAAYAVVGLSWNGVVLLPVAALLLTLGNIHVVRFYAGTWLRGRGLMESHLIGLGAVSSLIQFLPFRSRPLARRVEMVLAGFVLTLLAGNYFIQPNLEIITNTRFIASGLMAYFSGLYFYRSARRPDEAEAPFVTLWEGVYHYALTTAFWCAALLIPWFHRPEAAFIALGLPVLYFYARAESGGARAERYRNTAAFLSFMMWGLYFFRAAFQMVLFPGAPVGTEHYHFNAPWAMLLGLIMLRLRGLGGTAWLGFYGGLAVMGGSYFTLTRLPGLSPFGFPVPAAWCAVALGHFWILVTAQRSPVRAALQRLGAVDDVAWASLRRSWGICLLVATQAAAAWGLADYSADTYQSAPLLAGAASILLHMAWVRRSALYGLLGAAELLAALHMDFLIPSVIPKDDVAWVLLALWGVGLLLKLEPESLGAFSFGMAGATMAHVFYHHPSSSTGLWAVGFGATLAALTPRRTKEPSNPQETLFAGLLLFAPTWLTYFHEAPLLTEGWGSAFRAGPVLSASAALFLAGFAARLFKDRFGAAYQAQARLHPRLIDHTLSWSSVHGGEFFTAVLALVSLVACAVQVVHYDRAFPATELWLLLGLYGGSATAWFEDARRTRRLTATLFLQFCVTALFAVARRQIMLTAGFWNYEYDIWVSLAVSALFTVFKKTFDLQTAGVRYPMVGALWSLPALAISWAMIHHMGTHIVLLIVGLHSVLFAHMGKDNRESPYNAVAVAGFVSFVLIVFWTKLELRAVHAYVIPVGLGILTLLHLLRDRISVAVCNQLRLVTLLSMLGSAGYYALLDARYPLAFHLTVLLLGLMSMGFGSWLKVRVYLFLGFTGVVVDLASILFRVLVNLDRVARMAWIGGQVLALGAALVFGAIYYKTHQEEVSAALDRWRERLGRWQ